jgi:predicted aminopeptidase
MLRDSPGIPVRLMVAAVASTVLSGCYYTHLAAGQLEMNRRREPIEEVIARPGTDATLKQRLELAASARDFAMSDLGLPDNGSYRTFADLGRRYATWNVFAAPEFSVTPKRWCFPVAGCVSYRGYFDEARAGVGAQRRVEIALGALHVRGGDGGTRALPALRPRHRRRADEHR